LTQTAGDEVVDALLLAQSWSRALIVQGQEQISCLVLGHAASPVFNRHTPRDGIYAGWVKFF
jgi:hypothetical protein